jgi:hypothetical protein
MQKPRFLRKVIGRISLEFASTLTGTDASLDGIKWGYGWTFRTELACGRGEGKYEPAQPSIP